MTSNPLTKEIIYAYLTQHKFGVLSTVTANNHPEAAVVGFIVTPDLRIFCDTLSTSRKYLNILANPSVAYVVGWDDEKTVQLEGVARVPVGDELNALLEFYYKVFPDGKDRNLNWPDIAYIVVDPKWIRYSDFSVPEIKELSVG
jgi:general stress protein 26